MKEPVLINQRLLAVDDEPDVLTVIEEEISEACPKCILDKATTYEEAVSGSRAIPEEACNPLWLFSVMSTK
jgi:hypothetical protein